MTWFSSLRNRLCRLLQGTAARRRRPIRLFSGSGSRRSGKGRDRQHPRVPARRDSHSDLGGDGGFDLRHPRRVAADVLEDEARARSTSPTPSWTSKAATFSPRRETTARAILFRAHRTRRCQRLACRGPVVLGFSRDADELPAVHSATARCSSACRSGPAGELRCGRRGSDVQIYGQPPGRIPFGSRTGSSSSRTATARTGSTSEPAAPC